MGFASVHKEEMVKLKGVGHTVISRLEQLGFSTPEQLAQAQAHDVTLQVSKMIGSTCWHNSPQAKLAIQSIIEWAKLKI